MRKKTNCKILEISPDFTNVLGKTAISSVLILYHHLTGSKATLKQSDNTLEERAFLKV
jgi:hypothetical protein